MIQDLKSYSPWFRNFLLSWFAFYTQIVTKVVPKSISHLIPTTTCTHTYTHSLSYSFILYKGGHVVVEESLSCELCEWAVAQGKLNLTIMARAVASILVCMTFASVLLVAPLAEAAITCGTVTSSMTPCIPYLRSGGALPPACCKGVSSLNSMAKTTPDRQTACGCLKNAYNSIKGIQPALAAGLPGKCGVSIPYKISPATDCSK